MFSTASAFFQVDLPSAATDNNCTPRTFLLSIVPAFLPATLPSAEPA
jgi:hypothetical protein